MSANTNAASSSSTAVPSPTKAFDAYLPHLTAALDGLTTHAANLPAKSDLSFHRTLDRDFARNLDAASERVLAMTERLLSLVEKVNAKEQNKAKIPVKGKTTRRRKMEDEDDVVDGYKSVVGVVDGLLEDADSCLDELNGQKKKAAIAIKPALAATAGQKLPGPFTQLRERLPLSIFHAHDLPKPQLLFHDSPDPSSSTLWQPRLNSKPHAMVPLNFAPPLEYSLTEEEELDPQKEYWRREKEVRLRQHPYFYETRNLPYPTSMFIEAPPSPPPSFQEQPFQYVDTPQKLEEMVEQLRKAKEIAVDLEHHNMRSYAGFTCLIQISTREGDWIIDALKLRKELREGKLGDVMTDPTIIKVFHGAESDIVWLQHDFDIYVVNLFDTYHATVILRMEQHSLARLLQHYCDFEADKRYQRADWRIRPLPQGMLDYARSDTHFLLFVYDNLRNALLEQSSRPPSPDPEGNPIIETTRRNPQAAMREVLNRSADTALKLYEESAYDAETGKGSGGWLAPGRKWLPKGSIDEEPGYVWRKLHAWRDRMAREMDESPFYIMPNDILLSLSKLQGTAPILIRQVLEGDRAPVAKARATEIVKLVKEAKAEFAAASNARAQLEQAAKTVTEGYIIPKTIKTVITPAPAPTPIPDVWDAITVPAPSLKPAVKSSLFGSTIRTAAPTAPSNSNTSSAAVATSTSSLFGNALQSTGKNGKKRAIRGLSPGFADVQRSIHLELEPKVVTTAEEVKTGRQARPVVPETVPFVAAGQRKTVSGSHQTAAASSSTQSGEPSGSSTPASPLKKALTVQSEQKVKAEPAEDGVVQVKKSKKQKKRERVGSTAGPADEASKKLKLENGVLAEGAEDVAAEKMKAKKNKTKKEKVKLEDIPTFDYTNEPNLLDQPQSVSSIKSKKDKKKKQPKEQKGIGAVEIPTFGVRAARDLTQPKAGNKSGTFV